MQYYAARQRERDKRWDFTCRHGDHVFPVGYCSGWNEPILMPIEGVPNTYLWGPPPAIPVTQEWLDKHIAFKGKYHTEGHATKLEAVNCYREYLLDHRLVLNQIHADAQFPCAVCGAWTQLYAEIEMQTWVLCDAHNTRADVEKLFTHGEDWEIWSS